MVAVAPDGRGRREIRCGEAHYDAIDVDYAFGHDPVKLIEPSGPAPVVPILALQLVDDVDAAGRFVTHLPVYSLQAAAGYFADGHDVEVDGWVEVPDELTRIDDSMFVSQVVGRSMEPLIPDESYCIFRRIPAGSRQGKVVLAQHHDIADVETGGSYTVKRYESHKQESDGEVAGTIELRPVNPDFDPIVLEPGDEDEVQVIAELVTVLGSAGA